MHMNIWEYTTVKSAFAVLAEPNRRAILRVLSSSERSVGELMDELGLPQPSVSKHLKVLREGGFVESRVDAQRRVYRLNPGPLQEVDVGAGVSPASPIGAVDQSPELAQADQHPRHAPPAGDDLHPIGGEAVEPAEQQLGRSRAGWATPVGADHDRARSRARSQLQLRRAPRRRRRRRLPPVEPGGPSANSEVMNSAKAATSSQNDTLFMRGNAMSGEPIRMGTNQLPKPPISAGIKTKKIITSPWAETTAL